MTDQDRGAYAPPSDAPLSFDARQPVRGARPLPITLLVSALVLIGLIAAMFLFYQSGVRRAGQAPQTVGAPVGELKSAAPADAQPQDPAAGLQIYHAENGAGSPPAAAPKFTPPPEQPQARAEPAPAAAPTKPIAVAPELRPALPSAPPPAPAPLSAAKVEPPPKPEPAPKPEKLVRAEPVAKPAKVAKPPAEEKSAAAPATAGGAAVQIGAVSSTALADKAWSEAVAAAPGLAAGKGKGVEKIDRDGHTLFRTTVTGFASKADAATFCARLKAAGKACFVK
jgi:outer membrane biosynthesis protein TonB